MTKSKSNTNISIPNYAGLPCNEKDSKRINEELTKWKELRKKQQPVKGDELMYWQKKSSFHAL